MPLHQNIKDQIKDALRSKDTIRLDTLRGLNSLLLNEIVMGKAQADSAGNLSDDATLTIIKRAVKQRRDSIDQFTKGGREDLADKEKEELAILESYLPAMMPREEIHLIARQRIEKLKIEGAYDPKAGGKITGMIMKELAGRADGADVKAVVEQIMSA